MNTLYPYYGETRIELIKGITTLWCGRCEREFLAKIKDGQNDPTYECPRCKTPNKFDIKWKALN